MDLKLIKRERTSKLLEHVNVPVTEEMKGKLRVYSKYVNVNEMIREYLDLLIKEIESGKHNLQN